MNTKNGAWGKRLCDKLRPQKFCHSRSNQQMYALCFPIRYYDSSNIKFDVVMKI